MAQHYEARERLPEVTLRVGDGGLVVFVEGFSLPLTPDAAALFAQEVFRVAEEIGERVQRHRANLRAAGLRPVQIWVPDTRRPGFAEECSRQSRLVAG
jgi:hypothetical protein